MDALRTQRKQKGTGWDRREASKEPLAYMVRCRNLEVIWVRLGWPGGTLHIQTSEEPR